MTPERHQKIKKLFLATCELDEASRSAFLAQACPDDAELRVEVESLLKHHDPATLISPLPPIKAEGEWPDSDDRPTEETVVDSMDSYATEMGHQERFAPGTMIAQRYRIIAMLGRGGMGEVYRADDLKLEQPVALKFLSRCRADNSTWLARFYSEVRLARTVTHPNVCRVYDIGEAEGEAFISMEYVDGEDLASLLRRIGRLPSDKSIQIARQLCGGLGAAHEQGVLHRDLKPANIMIDGQGKVRITDFGIATLTTPNSKKNVVAGTPGYIAPEVLIGKPASVRSDIYSLGLVLYELVTGRPAFDDDLIAGRRKQKTLTAPSTWVEDVNPAVERVILQCIENKPENRPASAYEVAAALPGGDLLAAALAAGETPSPDMVAAARVRDVRPILAITCFIGSIIGLLAAVFLADRTFLLPQAGLTKAPAVLEYKAKKAIRALSDGEELRSHIHGFVIDPACLAFLRAHGPEDVSWFERLASSQPPAVFFEYLQGERRVALAGPLDIPKRFESAQPALSQGTKTVRLDPKGRLMMYRVVPNPQISERSEPKTPNWKIAFELAGLDINSFKRTNPVRLPPIYADTHLAWQGVYPDNPNVAIRVEGAIIGGEVVSFEVVQPWEDEAPRIPGHVSPFDGWLTKLDVAYSLFLATLVGGGILAWRNLRLGRGDRRGARHLALFMLCMDLLAWILGHQHVADFVAEAHSAIISLRFAIFTAAVMWVYYIALEPYVRRVWPQSIISWSRVLAGRIRDPLVGRDVLVGGLVGIAIILLLQINVLAASWAGLPQSVPLSPDHGAQLGQLMGFGAALYTIVIAQLSAVWIGLIFLMIMLLLRVTVRIPWLAAIVFLVVATAAFTLTSDSVIAMPWATHAIISIGLAVILVRVGFLAAISSLFTTELMMNSPITSDVNAWYAGAAGFSITVLIALLAFGLYCSLVARSFSRTGTSNN